MRILDTPAAVEYHLTWELEPPDLLASSLCFIICDEDRAVVTHCHVAGMPTSPTEADGVTIANALVHLAAEADAAAVLVALWRPGIPTLTPGDGVLYRAIGLAVAASPVQLLGVYVVTPHGLREVCLDDAL
jgi:hypothetical protein